MKLSKSELLADPFAERTVFELHRNIEVLGARVRFESNSEELLRLVDAAYAGLPRRRLARATPRLRVRLLVAAAGRKRANAEPEALQMMSASGLLVGATASSNFVMISPYEQSALVAVSPRMLRCRYHTRYELIEFAVFTLASRVHGWVPLHAACVAHAGHGVLVLGPSGAGKSTLTLQCLMGGWRILSEDSVFVAPDSLLASGVSNYLHVGAHSLRWIESRRTLADIRQSPVIRRRSGVRKYEIDLRRGGYALAQRPLKIEAVIFLTPESAAGGPLLRALSRAEALPRLMREQAYAAKQPSWKRFVHSVMRLPFFELYRGRHPRESVDELRGLMDSPSRVIR